MHIKTRTLAEIFFLANKPENKRRKLALKQLVKALNKQTGGNNTVKQIVGFVRYLYGVNFAFKQYIYERKRAR